MWYPTPAVWGALSAVLTRVADRPYGGCHVAWRSKPTSPSPHGYYGLGDRNSECTISGTCDAKPSWKRNRSSSSTGADEGGGRRLTNANTRPPQAWKLT